MMIGLLKNQVYIEVYFEVKLSQKYSKVKNQKLNKVTISFYYHVLYYILL